MAKIFNVDKLVDTIGEYVKVKIDLFKVDMIEKLSGLAALLISFITIFLVGLFLLAFVSLALGSYLNEVLASKFLGYLIVSGLYVIVLIVIVLILRSGKLKGFIENLALQSMENDEEGNNE